MFRLGERFVRTLWVKKMRGTAVAPTEYEFNIQNGKGIVLLSPLSQPLAAQPVAAASQPVGDETLRPFQVNGSVAADDPGKEILQPFEPEKLPNK